MPDFSSHCRTERAAEREDRDDDPPEDRPERVARDAQERLGQPARSLSHDHQFERSPAHELDDVDQTRQVAAASAEARSETDHRRDAVVAADDSGKTQHDVADERADQDGGDRLPETQTRHERGPAVPAGRRRDRPRGRSSRRTRGREIDPAPAPRRSSPPPDRCEGHRGVELPGPPFLLPLRTRRSRAGPVRRPGPPAATARPRPADGGRLDRRPLCCLRPQAPQTPRPAEPRAR